MRSLCFAAYVFGEYQKYIPLFTYSALRQYPQAYVKVYLDSTMKDSIKEVLLRIREELSSNFEVLENYTLDINIDQERVNIIGGVKKIYRWLLPEDEFLNFDYLYIGDIDVFFLREEIPLLDFHIIHCNKTGLPFSNIVRKLSTGNLTDRLTGLHFIDRRNYYEMVGPLISEYLRNTECLENVLRHMKRDEQFLYHLVSRSMDIKCFENDIILNDVRYRPWHGLHLRAANSKNCKMDIGVGEAYAPRICDAKRQMQYLIRDDLLLYIIKMSDVQEVYKFLRFLRVKMPYSFHFKYIVKRLSKFSDKLFRINRSNL